MGRCFMLNDSRLMLGCLVLWQKSLCTVGHLCVPVSWFASLFPTYLLLQPRGSVTVAVAPPSFWYSSVLLYENFNKTLVLFLGGHLLSAFGLFILPEHAFQRMFPRVLDYSP